MAPVANHTQDGPTGSLKADIESTFGSVEEFKEKFTDAAITLFGSGIVSCNTYGNIIMYGNQSVLLSFRMLHDDCNMTRT